MVRLKKEWNVDMSMCFVKEYVKENLVISMTANIVSQNTAYNTQPFDTLKITFI